MSGRREKTRRKALQQGRIANDAATRRTKLLLWLGGSALTLMTLAATIFAIVVSGR